MNYACIREYTYYKSHYIFNLFFILLSEIQNISGKGLVRLIHLSLIFEDVIKNIMYTVLGYTL